MREERLKILTMLQEGKITPEEAERLLAALSGSVRTESEDSSGRGRKARGFWDFDFDFTRHFDPEFRRFGSIFDDEFRRKFQEKMRTFRHSMRWADEQSRREAGEALREATEAVKEAVERSKIKETVEGIGKSVLDAMEEAMRRFSGSGKADAEKGDAKPEKAEKAEKPEKPESTA